ncbi:segregation and condensation protein A [Rhabdaerophilum calidifontis]|uniref:segregation and condensation protein A n=1 Tax=Rhabdaerophilum calidifontis TaxID=2604328 RepID=UPI00123B74AB|nr:ScpA family protein [Rhabdaerophilum calidifontis]
MSATNPETGDFTFEATELAESEGALRLVVDLDGFEGPLDLMLDLARRDRLDLRAIPIVALADQYLAFIRAASRLKLEIAGDYLVMAAWLTYLKSRLLLPAKREDGAPETEDLVADLAERLRRLETIRRAGEMLGERLGAARATFPRGIASASVVETARAWDLSLVDLLAAYAARRLSRVRAEYHIEARRTLSIPEARAILERLIGAHADWCPIDLLLAAIGPGEAEPRSARASAFVAALELAREGLVELRQEAAFAPLYLRGCPARLAS